ncbi:uncharacterized protein LOC125561118 [Nematostella vectensis]|uniref:uncharacterized protein LOC125561118 n=1 Tax=Nematostella vectensis TaxID=45351 RepID=UPI002076E297|nr:uncharacterized protein LOC125561118 [Nematostella vectensis]
MRKGNNMDLLKVVLSFTLLYCRHGRAYECGGFFEMPNSLLQGHVIETTPAASMKGCKEICTRNSSCFSINYNRKRSQCELNGATHFAFPENFQPGTAPDVHHAVVKPVASCSNNFCSSHLRCKMREGGKAYNCGYPEIYVKGAAMTGPLTQGVIIVDGLTFYFPMLEDGKHKSRGHNFVAVNCSNHAFISKATIDTHGDHQAGTKIVNYINALPNDVMVAIAVVDEGSKYLTSSARNAISTLGAPSPYLSYRQTYAFVGYKGGPKPAWIKQVKNSSGDSEITVPFCNCKTCQG